MEFVPTFLRKTITEQLSNSFFIACPHIFLLLLTSKLCTLWNWVSETWACLELKDWWEAWLSALTWKIIPSKWQMKKCSASSQSGRYLEDRQFPQGDEWKGSRMLRRKAGMFPVNCECRVGQMKAAFRAN